MVQQRLTELDGQTLYLGMAFLKSMASNTVQTFFTFLKVFKKYSRASGVQNVPVNQLIANFIYVSPQYTALGRSYTLKKALTSISMSYGIIGKWKCFHFSL